MAVVIKKKGDWLEAALPVLSSKTDRILAYLLSGGSLTVRQATLDFSLTSLAARIAHLRNALNIPIVTEPVPGDTGHIHGRYRIPHAHLAEQRARFPWLTKKGGGC
jgi:hypothetical protein